MTVFATIAFAAFLLEYDYLVALNKGSEYFTHYFGTFNGGVAHFHCAVGFSEENAVKFKLVSFFGGIAEIMNIQELVGFGLELLSLNFYNCVHLMLRLIKLTRRAEAPKCGSSLSFKPGAEKMPTKLRIFNILRNSVGKFFVG